MTTSIDAAPRPGGWIQRIGALLILAATAALVFAFSGAWTGDDAGPAMTTDQLRAAITTELRIALEQATPAEHQSHGHGLGGTVICAVDVLGFEPTDAAGLAAVRKVYATHMCAVSDNGRPWDAATKTAGSLVAAWGQPSLIQARGGRRSPPDTRRPGPPHAVMAPRTFRWTATNRYAPISN